MIGIFAVGHWTYWSQFEGLPENLMSYYGDNSFEFFESKRRVSGVAHYTG